MTDEEWQALYKNFETMDLIYAVDHIDKLRSFLGDRANLQPPEIRDDMMKLMSKCEVSGCISGFQWPNA